MSAPVCNPSSPTLTPPARPTRSHGGVDPTRDAATYRDSGTDFNRDEATVTRRVVALADRLATAAAEPPAQGRVPRRGAARVPLLGSRGLAPGANAAAAAH